MEPVLPAAQPQLHSPAPPQPPPQPNPPNPQPAPPIDPGLTIQQANPNAFTGIPKSEAALRKALIVLMVIAYLPALPLIGAHLLGYRLGYGSHYSASQAFAYEAAECFAPILRQVEDLQYARQGTTRDKELEKLFAPSQAQNSASSVPLQETEEERRRRQALQAAQPVQNSNLSQPVDPVQ